MPGTRPGMTDNDSTHGHTTRGKRSGVSVDSHMTSRLTIDIASHLANIALANVTREYPNKLDHILTSTQDLKGPRALHPIFYGSYDWHSCVHGYWLLTRLYRRFPDLPAQDKIRALFEAHITHGNVVVELAYLKNPIRRAFERPYGMAWLLMLGAELTRCTDDHGQRWRRTLAPLVDAFAERTRDYLKAALYPVRAGMHSNSAFALILALDYARAIGDRTLDDAICEKARGWFMNDADCPGWEPDGEDFLSPALTEALLMARVLNAIDFHIWLDRFLPRLAEQRPAALFLPATVNDRSDLRFSHLDGLNLSRAWCWTQLATALQAGDPRRTLMLLSAKAHFAASLPHIAGDYAGSHWLATFALLALDC